MQPADQENTVPLPMIELLNAVLERADNLPLAGELLSNEVRRLTGARGVVLAQCLQKAGQSHHRIVSISLASPGDLADGPELQQVLHLIHTQIQSAGAKPLFWHPGGESEVGLLLHKMGLDFSMAVPLIAGQTSQGCFLILGLPGQEQNSALEQLFRTLAPVVALVLRDSLLCEEQEQLIDERTRLLQASNDALRQSQVELSLRSQVGSIFLTLSGASMYHELMRVFLDATGSQAGFLGYLNEEGGLVFLDTTPAITQGRGISPDRPLFPSPQWQDNDLWQALGEKKTYFSNAPQVETPQGHLPGMRYAVVPVVHQDKVIGAILVANKAGDYTPQDIHLLEVIEQSLAPILFSQLQQERQERERQRAEAELRASEEKFRVFFDLPIIGTVFGDDKGNAFEANDEYLRISGFSREDLQAGRLDWRAITPPQYLAQDEKAMAEARERGVCTPYEKEYLRKDGSRAWVIIGFGFFGEGRTRSAAFVLDITERKRQTERLQAILDNIPLMIDSFDAQGRLLWANRSWEETLGWPLESAVADEGLFAAIYPDPARGQAVMKNILTADSQWRDGTSIARDGRPLDVSWANIRLSDGSMIGIGQDITARKQAEDALRASEEKLRAFFASGLFGTRTSSVDGPIYEANDEFLRMVGYSRQELEEGRLDWRKMTPPETLAQADQRIAEARQRGRCAPFEKQFIRKDGSRMWVLNGFILVGEFRQDMVSFSIDINERKQEAERMQAILANIPVMINYITPDGRLGWGNRCWEETLGVPLNEAQKLDVIKTFHPDDPPDQEAVRKQIEEADGQWRDSKITTPDGRVLDTSWANIRLSDGSHIGIGQDITGRKRVQEELRAREELYRTIVQTADEGISLVDAQNRMIFVNQKLAQILGYTREELVGQPMALIVSPDEQGAAAARIELRRQGIASQHEARYVRKDGTPVWTQVNGSPLLDKDGSYIGALGMITDITGRRAAGQALRESEKRYRLISENSADVIWTLDAQTLRFTYVSPSVQKLRGYTPEEVLAQSLDQALTPESYQAVVGSIPARLELYMTDPDIGLTMTSVVDQPRKDGSIVPTEVVTTLLTDAAGNVVEILGVSRDITERQKIEETLRKSEATLVAAQRLAEMGSADFDPVSGEATWSENLYRIAGMDPNQGGRLRQDENIQTVVFPEDRQKVAQVTKVALAGAAPAEMEFRILRRDGAIRFIHARAQAYLGPSANSPHLLTVFQDITDQKLTEAARRASEERFTSFMDHLPAMAFIKDQDSKVIFLNRYNKEFYGWEDDALGKHTTELVSPEEAARRVLEDRQAMAGKRVEQVETMTDRHGVVHTFKPIKFPIASQENPVLVGGLSIDISDQVRAEEEVRKLNTELELRVAARTVQLQSANQELEAFSYSVSHDLRAPLRAIDGFSRILVEDFSDELQPEARRFLGLVRSNTQQMGQLVDDLLAFSRLQRQPLHKQLIQPAEEVRLALQALSHEQEGRQVEVSLGSLPPCWADPTLIHQVFVNLLSNALKFTLSRSVAKIEVGFIPGPPPADLWAGQSVAGIYFIRDNGVGFDMRYASKLFTAFQRLHRAEDYEGNGIGLAIVQRIIKRHGGKVWAQAELNVGATFNFVLPEGSDANE